MDYHLLRLICDYGHSCFNGAWHFNRGNWERYRKYNEESKDLFQEIFKHLKQHQEPSE